jgi:hypothetical protein
LFAERSTTNPLSLTDTSSQVMYSLPRLTVVATTFCGTSGATVSAVVANEPVSTASPRMFDSVTRK